MRHKSRLLKRTETTNAEDYAMMIAVKSVHKNSTTTHMIVWMNMDIVWIIQNNARILKMA